MAAIKRKGSSSYWVKFQFNGQTIRRSARTSNRRRAEEYERALRRELHDRLVLGRSTATGTMTLREAVERYLRTHVKPKNQKPRTAKDEAHKFNALVERLGDETPLARITAPVIADYRDGLLEDGKAPATAKRMLSLLRAVLRKACYEWGTLAAVPTIKMPTVNNARNRWLRNGEERRLLNACRGQPHLRQLVVFLLDTGARRSEATGLTWDNVDLDRKPRSIVRFYETKSGQPRSVPLPSRAERLLRRLHRIRPKDQPRVFLVRLPGSRVKKTAPRSKPFERPRNAWYTAVANAGFDNFRIHDLRHTYASRLVMKGVPILTVSKLLGHASVKMTMRYAHLAPDHLDEAIGRLDGSNQVAKAG